jgi:hypothetical protein
MPLCLLPSRCLRGARGSPAMCAHVATTNACMQVFGGVVFLDLQGCARAAEHPAGSAAEHSAGSAAEHSAGSAPQAAASGEASSEACNAGAGMRGSVATGAPTGTPAAAGGAGGQLLLEYLPASALPPLYLIYVRGTAGRESGVVHAPVRQRWLDGDAEVVAGMQQLADLARALRCAATCSSSCPSHHMRCVLQLLCSSGGSALALQAFSRLSSQAAASAGALELPLGKQQGKPCMHAADALRAGMQRGRPCIMRLAHSRWACSDANQSLRDWQRRSGAGSSCRRGAVWRQKSWQR